MDKISPKKYIQTKARNLPIDKCFVNQNWEVSKLANVFVFRKHITGNITWGTYLIDLLCLGVKDTWYNFNVPADEIAELVEDFEDNGLVEIDYNLAHNIVFAGYDFATNIGLPPHKEFALTKFILEEDDDKIPIIDIEVGDENEVPHLMVNSDGSEKWAISILNKSIGEDSYTRSNNVGDFDDDDYEEGNNDEAEDIPLRSLSLADIEFGGIDASDAEMLTDEALFDVEAIQKRDTGEILCIGIEFGIRHLEFLGVIEKIENEDYVNTPEFNLFDSSEDTINSNKGEVYLDEIKDAFVTEELLDILKPLSKKKLENIFNAYKNNFYALYNLYVTLIWELDKEELRRNVCRELSNFTKQYPLATLLLAYESVNYSPDVRFAKIANSNNITDCFSQYETFGSTELLIYWLIKLKQNMKADNMQNSVFYYRLASDTTFNKELIYFKTQHDFSEYLQKKVDSLR